MKLMMVLIRDEDKEKVLKQLLQEGYTPTYIASTGEFLQFGKSLFLLGVEESEVEKVHKIVGEYTHSVKIKGGNHFQSDIFVMNARVEKVNTNK